MDSTALAILAASTDTPVLLITIASIRADNDDVAWAVKIAGHLPAARQQILSSDAHPLFFADLRPAALPILDEPASFAASASRMRHLAEILSSSGTRAHLNGQGGDEVLGTPIGYLRDLLFGHPALAWRRIRGHAALADVGAISLAAVMASPLPYRRWLKAATDVSVTSPQRPELQATGWEAMPQLPPWVTADTASTVRHLIMNASTDAAPLAGTPSGHHYLARLHAMARRSGQYMDVMGAFGVATHFPFLDRAVIEGCAAVRPYERIDPWQAKPLLRQAMTRFAARELMDRRTKGHYNADIMAGLAAHRHELLEIFDGSALASLGLIDDAVIRGTIQNAETSRSPLAFITEALACENWLRANFSASRTRTSRLGGAAP